MATDCGANDAVSMSVEDGGQEFGRICSQCSRMQKQSRQRDGWRAYTEVCRRGQGMVAIIPGSMLVWALLIATVAPCSVAARPDDQRRTVIPSGGHRDFPDNYYQQAEVAAVLDLLKAASQSRAQEDQWEDEMEPEDLVQGGPAAVLTDDRAFQSVPVAMALMRQPEEAVERNFQPLPVPMPLIRQPDVTGKNGDAGKEKRGSYMSLCHFKICNMGRKRNLRWAPWARNSPF